MLPARQQRDSGNSSGGRRDSTNFCLHHFLFLIISFNLKEQAKIRYAPPRCVLDDLKVAMSGESITLAVGESVENEV